MIRRRFLQLIAAASAGGLAPLASRAGESAKQATFRVKGFSCPTCATGLDTILCRQSGIVATKSAYPEGVVKVSYLPEKIGEERIVSLIAELGFTVEGRA